MYNRVYSKRFDLIDCVFFECETSNWLMTIFGRSSTNRRKCNRRLGLVPVTCTIKIYNITLLWYSSNKRTTNIQKLFVKTVFCKKDYCLYSYSKVDKLNNQYMITQKTTLVKAFFFCSYQKIMYLSSLLKYVIYLFIYFLNFV